MFPWYSSLVLGLVCVISLRFSILVVKEGNKLKIVKCVSVGLKKGRHLCFLLKSTYALSFCVCECASVSPDTELWWLWGTTSWELNPSTVGGSVKPPPRTATLLMLYLVNNKWMPYIHLICSFILPISLISWIDKSALAIAWTTGRGCRVGKVAAWAHWGGSGEVKGGSALFFSFRFYTCDLPTHFPYGRSADGFKTVGNFSYYVECFFL